MIKYSEKIVIRTNEDNTLEVPAENFKVENYIGNTITIVCKKYILEIDGNEISFLNENTRTDFLERINNFCVNGTSKSFNTNELSVINLWHVSKAVGDYHEGLASIKKNSKWGFIDKEGNEVISCKYEEVHDFYEGLAAVKKDGLWGFIDKEGNEVISCEYNNHCIVGDFHDGVARIRKNGKSGYFISWGFIDKEGNEVISCKYDEVRDFHEGLAAVKKDRKYYFINKTEEVVNKVKLVYIKDLKKDSAPDYENVTKVIPYEYDFRINPLNFHEELLMVKNDYGLWGFFDKKGNEVISCKYNEVRDFHEGLAAVNKNGLWGFIDKEENEVISCKYDEVRDFHEGVAAIKKENTWVYIDKKGNLLSSTVIIKDLKDIPNIPNNCIVLGTETAYTINFQENMVIFDCHKEREKFINTLNETINIDPDYNPIKITDAQKTLSLDWK